MLRLTEYIRDTLAQKPIRPTESVILIWNLTNRCNLFCQHCYAKATTAKGEEPTFEEIQALFPQLWQAGIRFIILSGGEPLIRKDIFSIARAMRDYGFRTSLSTNGLLIQPSLLPQMKEVFDYVGISIDGHPDVHDHFRAKKGAYDRSLGALRLCHEAGLRVGVRYTLTQDTLGSLPFLLDLVEENNFPKLYVSHLVYAGRAEAHYDLTTAQYHEAMKILLERAFAWVEDGSGRDLVTGNQEADAVLLLEAFGKRYPELREALFKRLRVWGGNHSGLRLVTINHKGEVRPDPFFPDILGSLQDASFTAIWQGLPEKKVWLDALRQSPRKLEGRCSTCSFLSICNGSSRPRAFSATHSYLSEDPACPLPSPVLG